jgi:hypothetical protein
MVKWTCLAIAILCLLWLPQSSVTAQRSANDLSQPGNSSPEQLAKDIQQVREALETQRAESAKQNRWMHYLAPIMSAFAAFCSAFIAYRMYKIHAENRVDAVRAEVMLDGWSMNQEGGKNFLLISKAFNVGKGPALSFGLIANTEDGSPIRWDGDHRLRDIRAGQEGDNILDARIPIDSCNPQDGEHKHIHLILRLFWTDLHEKKHLVNLLVHINLDRIAALSECNEAHILNRAQQIFMLKRKAKWFNRDSAFSAALRKGVTF